jgi:CDP-diacylglycerol--glycerol-3-phosphate 3-phosphatidyltransferase
MARWKVWLCAFTKPGSRSVPATRATLAGAAYCFAVSWTRARRSIPNALTIARFAAIPLFVWLYLDAGDGAAWGAGLFFVGAALTDQLDGYLARRWHVESRFGTVADPLADRLMIGTAAVLMLATGRIPILAALVIIGRDVLLVVGYRILSPGGFELEVTFLGKLATWVLYAALALVLVTAEGARWPLVLLWIGIVLALGAGVQYGVRAWRQVHPEGTLEPRSNPDED